MINKILLNYRRNTIIRILGILSVILSILLVNYADSNWRIGIASLFFFGWFFIISGDSIIIKLNKDNKK